MGQDLYFVSLAHCRKVSIRDGWVMGKNSTPFIFFLYLKISDLVDALSLSVFKRHLNNALNML